MLSSKSKQSTPDNMKFLAGNGGAINKSLLTPCRRVGLSRKSKTPLQGTRSNAAISNVEAIISPASIATSNKKLSFTPEMKQPSTSDVIGERINNESTVRSMHNKKNTKVVKNIQNETNFSDNNTKQTTQRENNACNVKDDNKNTHKKGSRKKNEKVKTETHGENKCETLNPYKSCDLTKVDSDDDIPKKRNKPTKRKILDDDDSDDKPAPESPKSEESPVSKTTNKKLCKDSPQHSCFIKKNIEGKELKIVLKKCDAPNHPHKTSNEGFREDDKNISIANTSATAQKLENAHKKTVKKSLSLKWNSNCSQDHTDLDELCVRTNNSTTNSPVKDTNNVLVDSYNNILDSDTVINFNNVLANQSSDEEDFQPSPGFVNNITNDIKTLRKRIQEKEQELNKLKQAEIYKKLHKTEELKQLTAVWKIGCKHALQDLQRLASTVDSSFDMPKLLQKLNVPNEIFTCTPNGTLI